MFDPAWKSHLVRWCKRILIYLQLWMLLECPFTKLGPPRHIQQTYPIQQKEAAGGAGGPTRMEEIWLTRTTQLRTQTGIWRASRAAAVVTMSHTKGWWPGSLSCRLNHHRNNSNYSRRHHHPDPHPWSSQRVPRPSSCNWVNSPVRACVYCCRKKVGVVLFRTAICWWGNGGPAAVGGPEQDWTRRKKFNSQGGKCPELGVLLLRFLPHLVYYYHCRRHPLFQYHGHHPLRYRPTAPHLFTVRKCYVKCYVITYNPPPAAPQIPDAEIPPDDGPQPGPCVLNRSIRKPGMRACDYSWTPAYFYPSQLLKHYEKYHKDETLAKFCVDVNVGSSAQEIPVMKTVLTTDISIKVSKILSLLQQGAWKALDDI